MRPVLALSLIGILTACGHDTQEGKQGDEPPGPTVRTYREVGGRRLQAHVFPASVGPNGAGRSAVLLFHGGGWHVGNPEWTYGTAERFSSWGLVAIAIEYRLADEEITPIDALADACAAFVWTRENAGELGIDPARVAGYGLSAGGHLVASTPPTSIVLGREDTLTPLEGASRFCDELLGFGVLCELHVYEGLGHLLTRNLENQEWDFDPDPAAEADGIVRHRHFLRQLGFLHPG